MLRSNKRFRMLASALPLVLAGVFARVEWLPSPRPCITVGETSVQIAPSPWQAELNVSFTADPARATVRVQVVDSPEAADFTVVDDVDVEEASACEGIAPVRFVAITAAAAAMEPVIYLSQDTGADYRIYVRSKRFTPREAAALIVGASGGHPRIAAAAL
jgi:hypothetical protein